MSGGVYGKDSPFWDIIRDILEGFNISVGGPGGGVMPPLQLPGGGGGTRLPDNTTPDDDGPVITTPGTFENPDVGPGSVGVPGGQGSVDPTGGLGGGGGAGAGGGSAGGGGPSVNTGNEWLDYILGALIASGINVGTSTVSNQLFEALNGSAGDRLREFLSDAYPDLTQWELAGAGAQSGFAANQGGQLQQDALRNQLKIAEIQYRQAVDSSTIASQPGHRQAAHRERMEQPEIAQLRADTFYRESEVSLLSANIRSAESEAIINEMRGEFAEAIVNLEMTESAARNLLTFGINLVDATRRVTNDAYQSGYDAFQKIEGPIGDKLRSMWNRLVQSQKAMQSRPPGNNPRGMPDLRIPPGRF